MTGRGWGNDLTFAPDKDPKTAKATGWRDGLKGGDYLLLNNPASSFGVSYYKIKAVTYCVDPPDMWHADLEWVPIGKCKHLITNPDILSVLDAI